MTKRIGPYTVQGVLGEGGTGIVYDAVDGSGRAVALKVMQDALAGDQQIRGRFIREAGILRRLAGEHVCPILDFGEVPTDATGKTLLYIALPKIEGRSLADLLQKDPPGLDRTLDIMLEVLGALASAHAQGIVHRDLKPANVLLEHGEKVIVVDFGMAKIITGSVAGTTNLTKHNMLFGTPEYMSPEQARGDELDARCDVYAAGIMLYEMLTGAPPFTGASPLTVLTAHLTNPLVPPKERARPGIEVSDTLDAVVRHALAREPGERYASAAQMAEALRQVRPTRADALAATMPASHPPASIPVMKPAPEEKPPTSKSVVDVTAPTLVGPPSLAPRARTNTAPPRVPSLPPPAKEPFGRMWVLAWIVVGTVSIAAGVWFALRS